MRPHRKHMSPFHLDMMIFLRCNKDLWNEVTVEDRLNETPNTAAVVPAAVAAEENAVKKIFIYAPNFLYMHQIFNINSK